MYPKKPSADFEDISMDIVAKVVSVICKPLTHICTSSIRTGVFPSKVKIAKVIPMFKSGAKTDLTNYRPIFLLRQFTKILEKLFLTRTDSFVDASAVMELIEEISKATYSKTHAIGVFIDLK